MVSFSVTLSTVLQTLFYMLPGFLISKCGKVKPEHMSSASAILLYVCAPCMFASNLISQDPSPETFAKMGIFALLTMVGMLLFMFIQQLLLGKKKEEFRFRMMNCASVMGNVGFFGLPIVKAVFPNAPEAAAFSCVYCATMNILAWTFGAFSVTGEKKYISLKAAFINPTVFSVTAGILLCLLRATDWMPSLITGGIESIGLLTTPLSMIILGIRLTTMSWKEIFGQPLVYATATCKLFLFPLFCFGLSLLVPMDPIVRACALILSGTPCASILLNLSEIHGHGQKLAADCALMSTLLCFLTIPVLTLLL